MAFEASSVWFLTAGFLPLAVMIFLALALVVVVVLATMVRRTPGLEIKLSLTAKSLQLNARNESSAPKGRA